MNHPYRKQVMTIHTSCSLTKKNLIALVLVVQSGCFVCFWAIRLNMFRVEQSYFIDGIFNKMQRTALSSTKNVSDSFLSHHLLPSSMAEAILFSP